MAFKKKSSCPDCGEEFPSKAKLTAHAKSHKAVKTRIKQIATRSSTTPAPESQSFLEDDEHIMENSKEIEPENETTKEQLEREEPVQEGHNGKTSEKRTSEGKRAARKSSERKKIEEKNPEEEGMVSEQEDSNEKTSEKITPGGRKAAKKSLERKKLEEKSHKGEETVMVKLVGKIHNEEDIEILEKNQQEKRKTEVKDSRMPSKKLKTQHACQKCSKTFALKKTLKRHQEICQDNAPDQPKLESPTTRSSMRKSASKPVSYSDYDFKDSDDDIDADFKGESEDEESSEEFKEQMKGPCCVCLGGDFPTGKITTRVRSLLKDTCGRRPELCTSCDPGEDETWLQCDKCPKEFKLRASLDRHRKVVHMDGASHQCDTCGTRCADKGTLARHMYIHTGVKPYQCEVCKKQFSRKYHLFRHMQQTGCGGAPPQTFPCQVCGKLFNRNDNLREHLRIHAGDTIRKRKHTCEHCNKEFHCPSMLTVHIRTHTGEKPFKCDLCKKAFPSDGALKKHGRVHSGERPYECKECGSRFSLKGTLNRHLRTHSGIRPHKCQFCPREFIQIGGLKAHLFYHTGENGFSCERCGKCFNRKARLDMHIRYVHEKVKPFTCKECGKAFVRKEDLNRHSVLHTGVKAFQCPTCDKTFAIQPSLKLHLLTHRKEPPRSCEECGRAFIRQDCLLRHMRKRHRDVLDRLIANVEKKVLPILKTDVTTADPLQKQSLEDSIKELLSLLVDEATLKAFGWPEKAIDELLEAVINRCGHTPVDPGDYSFMDRLRENCKLLFTVVIDDTAVKTLLNNHTVDEVILHVLRLAKT